MLIVEGFFLINVLNYLPYLSKGSAVHNNGSQHGKCVGRRQNTHSCTAVAIHTASPLYVFSVLFLEFNQEFLVFRVGADFPVDEIRIVFNYSREK